MEDPNYDTDISDALLQKAKQDALQAEFAARREEVACAIEEYEYERRLSGVYTLNGEIKPKKVDSLINNMRTWHDHDDSTPWTIYVNSVGGDAISGLGLVDEMRSYSLRGGGSHEITIKVRGQAASMAAYLLQVADIRMMGASSNMMIHEPSAEFGGHWGQIDDDFKWLQALRASLVGLFVERTSYTESELLQRIDRRDWWLNSTQALEEGFIDSVG